MLTWRAYIERHNQWRRRRLAFFIETGNKTIGVGDEALTLFNETGNENTGGGDVSLQRLLHCDRRQTIEGGGDAFNVSVEEWACSLVF